MKHIWLSVNSRENLKSLLLLSILAEPPVAIVEKNAKKDGNEHLAKAYLNYLYSPAGQTVAAKNFYRPRNANVLKQYSTVFKSLNWSPLIKSLVAGPRYSETAFSTMAVSLIRLSKPIMQNNAYNAIHYGLY